MSGTEASADLHINGLLYSKYPQESGQLCESHLLFGQ